MDEKWSPTKRYGSKSYSKGRSKRRLASGQENSYSSPSDLAQYLIKVLSREPDSLEFECIEKNSWKSIISVTCDPSDLGRLIGKDGKTIGAIRNLVNAASAKFGKSLEIKQVINLIIT